MPHSTAPHRTRCERTITVELQRRRKCSTTCVNRPGFDVAALLHEGTHGEPKTVEDGEVVGDGRRVAMVLDVPLERTKPADEEQHNTDAEVRRGTTPH